MALKEIPLNQIRENPVALRSVNKQSEEFKQLVDSIKSFGVLNAINVREMRDADTNQKYYSLIDGLHRYTGSQEAGKETIPAQIVTLDDGKVLEAQLIANLHKVETRPIEFAHQLSRILAQDPTLTQSALAVKLSVSPSWLVQRLGLVKLEAKIAKVVEDGQITLSNAFVLAKLPIEEQANFVERAMAMSPAEFTPTVQTRIKELRDAKREGRTPGPTEFVPIAHLRKMGEIKTEADAPTAVSLLVRQAGLTTPDSVIKFTLEWALHLDPQSIEAAKAKDAQRKAEDAANKEARKKERDAKKDEAAKATQAAIQSAGQPVTASA